MNGAKISTNRCFGQKCPSPEQRKEKRVKDALLVSARQRKDANWELSQIAERHHCGLAGILGAVEKHVGRGEMSLYVFKVLIERVDGQRKRNGLTSDEVADLERAKIALEQFKR